MTFETQLRKSAIVMGQYMTLPLWQQNCCDYVTVIIVTFTFV